VITRVVKSRKKKGDWSVEIQHRCQYFRLDYHSSRADAQWMAGMFRKALKKHDEEKRREQ